MADRPQLKIAYHIKKEEGREKAFFNRIGKAWVNKDGSINLFLDYLPLPTVSKDGKVEQMTINIRDYEPKEKKEADSFGE